MMRGRLLGVSVLVAAVVAFGNGSTCHADAMARMSLAKLKATHDDVAALAAKRQKVSLESGYDDYRTLMHVHSAFSHDSRGKIEEIVAAAKAVGARVVMFTEHPAPHYDYYADGHRGLVDGVLLIPGAETEGYLAFPKRSLKGESAGSPQAFSDLVTRDGGLSFVCHLEERLDWRIRGVTGTEIYNTHADVKDELGLLSAFRSVLGLVGIQKAVAEYPQETFATLLDYPEQYLAMYDELCQRARHTGVSANDAHHNQGFRAVLLESGSVRMEDPLGEKLLELDPMKVPLVKSLTAGKKPGDVVFAIDLDPYERSFRHVSTHLLINEQTESAVWDALTQGRAYVAFDWMGDPSGFVYRATRGDEHWPIGGEVECKDGVLLEAEAPLTGEFRLVRNGALLAKMEGRQFEFAAKGPGVYRVEVWLSVGGELRPWILSNPIYVR